MGKDNRGHSRKECLVKDCDCEEYERPGEDENCNSCSYCGCPPAKHKRDDSSNSQSSVTIGTSHENSDAERGLLRVYSSAPKWKDTKYGYVPHAKRKICLFGNKLLPTFFDSFKARAGTDAPLMKRMFTAERDRQYNITVDIEQLESRFRYLLSDNPACAGRFLHDDYKPKPHDNSNIIRCKTEANEIKLKLQAIKDKIVQHDNSLFSENTGKLKTGLSCHHSFNNDKSHNMTSHIQKDVDHLIEDLDRASTKYWATYHIGSKSKSSQSRKKKEQKKKGQKRKVEAADSRRKRACVILRSLGGTPHENEYDPEICGVPQLDSIQAENLSVFTSKTDKACLRDLLQSNCFLGEAAGLVRDVCN